MSNVAIMITALVNACLSPVGKLTQRGDCEAYVSAVHVYQTQKQN
jgi:hypothetical protein